MNCTRVRYVLAFPLNLRGRVRLAWAVLVGGSVNYTVVRNEATGTTTCYLEDA